MFHDVFHKQSKTQWAIGVEKVLCINYNAVIRLDLVEVGNKMLHILLFAT